MLRITSTGTVKGSHQSGHARSVPQRQPTRCQSQFGELGRRRDRGSVMAVIGASGELLARCGLKRRVCQHPQLRAIGHSLKDLRRRRGQPLMTLDWSMLTLVDQRYRRSRCHPRHRPVGPAGVRLRLCGLSAARRPHPPSPPKVVKLRRWSPVLAIVPAWVLHLQLADSAGPPGRCLSRRPSCCGSSAWHGPRWLPLWMHRWGAAWSSAGLSCSARYVSCSPAAGCGPRWLESGQSVSSRSWVSRMGSGGPDWRDLSSAWPCW